MEGNYHYLPADEFTGVDTISFSVTDGVNTDTSTVFIFVQQTNEAILNFSLLNGVAANGRITIAISAMGRTTTTAFNFTASPTAGTDLAAAFAAAFQAADWTVTRDGTQVRISTVTVGGERRQLQLVSIRYTNVAASSRITRVVSDGVTVREESN